MKSIIKPLLVAAALATFVGQAAAAISDTNAILYVWDSGNSSSYIQDLGSAGNFSPSNSGTQTFMLSGANWNSFISQGSFAADLATGKVKWGVTGSASTASFFSTIAQGQAATLPDANAISNVHSALQLATASSSAPTDFAAANSTGLNNWNLQSGNQLTTSAGFNTGNAIGATGVPLAEFVAGANGASPFIQTASLTMGGAMLTIAAVPEPESYALMFVGMLMVGGMIRYRKS